MDIIIDKRIELMAVIQTIDNFWDNLWLKLFNKKLYQCKYKENVFDYFGKYKNHEIIKLWNKLSKTVQDVSVFIKLPLCYSNPPELNNIASIENNINLLTKVNFPYEEFIGGIKQFYEESKFEIFFEKNKNEYGKILNDYMEKKDVIKYFNSINNYLDTSIKNYNVIISSLLTDCYGFKILTNDNKTQNYSVICAYDYIENKYIFGSEYSALEVLWHEISHLTIDDLNKKYLNQVDLKNNKKISDELVKYYYTNAKIVLNEYIVIAITIRQFEINNQKTYADSLIQYHVKRGFTEIESVKNYISKYCEYEEVLLKDKNYIKLMEYVISKIYE